MIRFALPALGIAMLFGFAGCGPLKSPMPQRLEPELQAKIDDGWNRTFTPTDRHGRQELLDIMVGVQAYQLGVDSLTLRSEKRFAGGRVVMEVHFDRAKPDGDRFDVTVYDPAGKQLRSERFSRNEVEETYRGLFVNPPPPKDPKVAESPEEATRRTAFEGRWKVIQELFPKPDEAGSPPQAKPRSR